MIQAQDAPQPFLSVDTPDEDKPNCCMPIWLIVLISVLAVVGVGLLIWLLWPKSDAQKVKSLLIQGADLAKKVMDPKTKPDERAKLQKKMVALSKDLDKLGESIEKKDDKKARQKMKKDFEADPKVKEAEAVLDKYEIW